MLLAGPRRRPGRALPPSERNYLRGGLSCWRYPHRFSEASEGGAEAATPFPAWSSSGSSTKTRGSCAAGASGTSRCPSRPGSQQRTEAGRGNSRANLGPQSGAGTGRGWTKGPLTGAGSHSLLGPRLRLTRPCEPRGAGEQADSWIRLTGTGFRAALRMPCSHGWRRRWFAAARCARR